MVATITTEGRHLPAHHSRRPGHESTQREGNILKTLELTCLLGTLLLGTSLVLAQAPADEHAGHHPEGTPPPATTTQPAGKSSDAPGMDRMQGNMKKMQDLMSRIHASKDGTERQLLMQQHSKAMHDQMNIMRSMQGGKGGMAGGDMMMGEGMKGGGSQPPNAQLDPPMGDGMMDQMMKNHQAMQDRVGMMEMMMGQMLEHQAAQDAKPAK